MGRCLPKRQHRRLARADRVGRVERVAGVGAAKAAKAGKAARGAKPVGRAVVKVAAKAAVPHEARPVRRVAATPGATPRPRPRVRGEIVAVKKASTRRRIGTPMRVAMRNGESAETVAVRVEERLEPTHRVRMRFKIHRQVPLWPQPVKTATARCPQPRLQRLDFRVRRFEIRPRASAPKPSISRAPGPMRAITVKAPMVGAAVAAGVAGGAMGWSRPIRALIRRLQRASVVRAPVVRVSLRKASVLRTPPVLRPSARKP